MKQLVVLSGKGGTGKTTITAALAHLASQEMTVVLVDADVDAANLDLVLAPAKQDEHDFLGGKAAIIDPDLCNLCGLCAEVCRFDAVIWNEIAYIVDALACEGCASCFYQCPEEAIRMEQRRGGLWFRSDTRFGPLFHAHLFAGEENSGKLVTCVKQAAHIFARELEADLLLVDGPPGIGCPVISAVAGADAALLVVEPTVSGIHDLTRILATANHFNVPPLVVINKVDLNPARAGEIITFCAEHGTEMIGQVPYDTIVTQAMVDGEPVTAYTDGDATQTLQAIWRRIREWFFDGEEGIRSV